MPQSARLAPTYATGGLLGSLPGFRRDPLDLLMRGFGAAGDAVRFRLFTRSVILLAHPTHARHVLQERGSNYSKRTRGFAVLRDLLREGLLTSEGAHWLRQRRIAQPAFHRTRIASFGDTMTRAASDQVDRWLESREAVHDISADMMRLTLRIVGETLLSTDVSRKADRVGQALSSGQAIRHSDASFRDHDGGRTLTPGACALRYARWTRSSSRSSQRDGHSTTWKTTCCQCSSQPGMLRPASG